MIGANSLINFFKDNITPVSKNSGFENYIEY